MSDLATDQQLSGTVRLYDIASAAAEANVLIGNQLTASNTKLSLWQYVKADSLKEVLEGCDFVIISILPGTFDHMAIDVHHPEKYGIHQSVGDSVGPGAYEGITHHSYVQSDRGGG